MNTAASAVTRVQATAWAARPGPETPLPQHMRHAARYRS
jgi:hypothetical protein